MLKTRDSPHFRLAGKTRDSPWFRLDGVRASGRFRARSWALALVLVTGVTKADVVYLKNGKTLEGTVTEGAKKGTLDIRTGEGASVTIQEAEVERIERKPSPLDEFESRWKALPAGEKDALADLLVWARDKQLYTKVKAAAKRILEIDPNDELGRKELGYVVFENRWILEAELKKKKGLVRFRDEWMTQAEKDRRVAAELRREMEDLLGLVGSENTHFQEFAVRKLLSFQEPAAREVFAAHLRDPREATRWVAVRGIASFPVKGPGDAVEKGAAADLHRLALEETNEKGLRLIYYVIQRFFPSESARLAAETLRASPDERERRRAAEIEARIRSARGG